MSSTLTFDEPTHVYRLDGVVVPSVTTIIEAAGLVDLHGNAEQLDYARALGSASHLATELDDLGALDESSVAEPVWPRLKAWRKFRRETGFEPEHIEERLAHPLLRYAGTIDRIGTMRKHRMLLDIKNFAKRRTTGLQLAAYAELAHAAGLVRRDIKRYACHLYDDGRYELVPYTGTRDFPAFMAALTLFHWKKEAA
jgi:hypothetical protein